MNEIMARLQERGNCFSEGGMKKRTKKMKNKLTAIKWMKTGSDYWKTEEKKQTEQLS
jgi:hypothetical protein